MVEDEAFSHEIDYVTIFNRPGVAGAVLQTALLLIDSVSQSAFSSGY